MNEQGIPSSRLSCGADAAHPQPLRTSGIPLHLWDYPRRAPPFKTLAELLTASFGPKDLGSRELFWRGGTGKAKVNRGEDSFLDNALKAAERSGYDCGDINAALLLEKEEALVRREETTRLAAARIAPQASAEVRYLEKG
ncbi:MAG: hypothetical protein HYU64_16395 [Armatimonadetes bacterium]|nr:hypothetical protein [Armatimonadota bacterium]